MRNFICYFFYIYFIFGLSYHVQAQTKFKKGCIITSTNDTIEGYIKNINKSANYKWCYFKSDIESPEQIYRPDDLIAYQFYEEKHFISKKLPGNIITDSSLIFLEKIIDGKITLYRYQDSYFIEKDTSGLIQLKIDKIFKEYKGVLKVKYHRSYVGILKYFLSDCPKLFSEIEELRLNERHLTRLLKSYYSCTGNNYIHYKQNIPWTKVSYEIYSGVGFSKMKFRISDYYYSYVKPSITPVSISPLIGGNVSFSFPHVNERFSFKSGLIYFKNNYTGSSHVITTLQNYYVDYYIKEQSITLPVFVYYIIPARYFNKYLLINASYKYNFGYDSYRLTRRIVQEDEIISEQIPWKKDASHLGFGFGGGISKILDRNLEGFIETRVNFFYGKYKELHHPFDLYFAVIPQVNLIVGIKFLN